MATETGKPKRRVYQSELLSSEDGTVLMVRGKTLDDVLATAHEEAAADDYVLTDPDDVRMAWLRKIPCPGTEHETDGGLGMPCDGIKGGFHVIESKPGRGAIRGAIVDVMFAGDLEDDDPGKARYLAECAAMEARRA
jgi:hypothetical protein